MKLSEKEKELLDQAFRALIVDLHTNYARLANSDNHNYSEFELLARRARRIDEVLKLQEKIQELLNTV